MLGNNYERGTTKMKNRIRLITIIILSVISLAVCFTQVKRDVVYLKTGGKAIGEIIKKVDGEPVILKLQSDETMTIEWESIKEFGEITIDTIAHPLKPFPEAEKILEPAHNAIYFEALGAGILYSINYERFITKDVTLRIGYSSWSVPFFGLESFIGVPVMVHDLIGSGNSKLDIGLGLEYVKIEYGNSFLENAANAVFQSSINNSGELSTAVGIGAIAYRYQPYFGGLYFQIGYYPFFSTNGFAGRIGMSGGLCF